MEKLDYKTYWQQGVGYDQYKKQMAEDHASNNDIKIKDYITLNQQRMYRVEKTYAVSTHLADQIKNLGHKIYWLIITEHWCGDAAQILPVLNAIVNLSNGKIEMRLVYRDQNAELMDAWLTNGTRSIPKVIQFDEHFNLTGAWGPRPAVAQQLVRKLRADPATVAIYSTDLHLWYAKDKQKSTEAEIAEFIGIANKPIVTQGGSSI